MHVISPASNLPEGSGEIILGAIEIAVGVMTGNPYLIAAGIGTIISGIGTLMAKGPLGGVGSATRNPIAPWIVNYGRTRMAGIIVYLNSWAENNQFIDLVIVLASHTTESIDALLFDGHRVQIDPATGCSFTPVQQTIGITSIIRSNGVVTVSLPANIPLAVSGDFLAIENVPGDLTLNGRYQITVESQVFGGPGSIVFSYICGGADANVVSAGQVRTLWPDYGAKVYYEALLGDHVATFDGMLTGTPYDGDTGNIIKPYDADGNAIQNPWSAEHKLLGKTCVMLRLHYDDIIFANGIPQISFLVHGKNDIYDPRTSLTGYTENAALCIADYLANQTYGYRAVYDTEIPSADLIAAANICDELVPLADGGTEARYTCNGQFPLSMKRGEVLQNLLTSCAGRLAYVGGEFKIYPAACIEPTLLIPSKTPTSAILSVSSYMPAAAGGVGDTYDGTATIRASQTAVINPDHSVTGMPGQVFNSTYSVCFRTKPYTATDTFNLDTSKPIGDTIVFATLYGSLSGAPNNDTPHNLNYLYITEVHITVTYDDGSVVTLTPSSTGQRYPTGTGIGSFFGGIQNDHFNPLTDYQDFWCKGWSSSSTPGTPDLTPSGFTGSGAALAMAAGPFRWCEKLAIRDLFNGVKGTYISPANNWQTSDIPPYAQDTVHGYASGSPVYAEGDANLFADGGDRRWKDIQLPFTISVATAQRLAKIELLTIRNQGTGTFKFNLAVYQATVLDVISMTLPVLGWVNKTLQIMAFRFTLDRQQMGSAEVTLLGTEIDVQEYDCSTYDWDTSEELNARGFQQGALPPEYGRLSGITPVVSVHTATTYTAKESDRGNLLSFVDASPPAGATVNVTVPTAGTGQHQFDQLWNAGFQNRGTGNLVITPTGSTIDGASSLTILPGTDVWVYSDGISNYYTQRGGGSTTRFVDNESPAMSSPPGATMTLSQTPNPAASLQLYVNGVQQIASEDFTLSGATITYLRPTLSINDVVRAFYRY